MRKEPLLTAVPPVPVRSLNELYAIAFDQAQKAAQQYGALAKQTDERLLPVRPIFEVLATRERNRCDNLSALLPPAASVPTRPICAGRRSISFPPRKSPTSGIPACRRLTPRGRLRPATASAPSCSGLMSSRLPKILWYAGRQSNWRMKRYPTAICCAASGGLPGAPNERSTARMQRRMTRESTKLARRRCWKVFSSET